MKQITFIAAAFLYVVLVPSCGKDEEKDSTKPIINLIEPADGDTLFIGHDVHFDLELSDDVKLKSYKVDIHNDFDGHNHAKSTQVGEAWSYSKSWDISGLKNTDIHHHEIVVPDSINGSPIAKGAYHFGVYVTDEAGNESKVFVDVIVWDGAETDELLLR